jgi:hypothetical protein
MPKEHIYEQAKNVIEQSEDKSIQANIFMDKMANLFNVSKSAIL